MNQFLYDDRKQRKELSKLIGDLTFQLKCATMSIDFNQIEQNLDKIKQLKKELHELDKINYAENAEKAKDKVRKKIQKLSDQIDDRKNCYAIFSSISDILNIIKNSMEGQLNVDNQLQSDLQKLMLNLKHIPKYTKLVKKLLILIDHFNSIIIQLTVCKGIAKVSAQDQRLFEEIVRKWKTDISIKKNNIKNRQVELVQVCNQQQAEINDKQQIELLKKDFLQLDVSSDSSQEFEKIGQPQQVQLFKSQHNQNQVENFQQQLNEDLGDLDCQTILYESIILIEKFNQKQLQLIKQVEEEELISDYPENNQQQQNEERKKVDNCSQQIESIIIVEIKQDEVQKSNKEEKQDGIGNESLISVNQYNNSINNYMESIILVEKYNQKLLQINKKEQQEEDIIHSQPDTQNPQQGTLKIKQNDILEGALESDNNRLQRDLFQEGVNKEADSSSSEQEAKQFRKENKNKHALSTKHTNTYYKQRKEVQEKLRKEKNKEKLEQKQIRNQQKKERKLLKEQGEQGMLGKEK